MVCPPTPVRMSLQHTHIHKVTDVVHVTEGGFDKLHAIVEGLDTYKGHKVKVLAKNENYLVRYMESGMTDGAVMACTPDLISMADPETGIDYTL